jgi:hypothetical protein
MAAVRLDEFGQCLFEALEGALQSALGGLAALKEKVAGAREVVTGRGSSTQQLRFPREGRKMLERTTA